MICGDGQIESVGKHVKKLGCSRAFVVSDPGLKAAGVLDRVTSLLEAASIEVVVFPEVPANPTFDCVAAGIAKLAGRFENTAVLSLGGGSSMDAAKAMAVIGPQCGSVDNTKVDAWTADLCKAIGDYTFYPQLSDDGESMDVTTMRPKRVGEQPPLPIIAVPTTSGTASETNGAAVLTDAKAQRKVIFSDDRAAARLAILDPALTLGLPAYPTATCGMDVLTHALEALTSARRNPYSGAIAMGAIQTVAQWLPVLMNDLSNSEARLRMMTASHMAGVAFGIAGLGICHAMGHPLSAVLHQAHGQTLATLLPHVMRFNMEECVEEYAAVARAFGVADAKLSALENAEAAVAAVAALSIRVGTARSIRAMGGNDSNISELCDQAMLDICMLTTPRMASRDDIATIYRQALDDPTLYPASAKL